MRNGLEHQRLSKIELARSDFVFRSYTNSSTNRPGVIFVTIIITITNIPINPKIPDTPFVRARRLIKSQRPPV